MTSATRLTLKQFLDLPDQKPALEFDADGTIHEKMSPNTEHSALQLHIGRLLLNWIDVDPPRRRGYAYSELRTNVAGASKLPDVSYYRHRPRESQRKHALEIADLSIEILSPRDDLDEQIAKCEWYLENGGQVALLIDPVERSIRVFRPLREVEVAHGHATVELLQGLELALDRVFAVLGD
jgi:Uma2 family endonuclease